MRRNKVVLFLASILAFSATLAFGACENQGQGTVHTCSYTEEKAEDTYLKTAATCEGKAVYYKSCVCGEASETDTFENGEALGHEYGEWMTNNNGTHSRTCEHDSAHVETKDCRGGAATCTEQATCEDCGTKYGEALGHEYGEWTSNGDGTHSRTCEHDSAHVETKDCSGGTATCTEQATCEDCGAKYGELEEHSFTIEKAEEKYLKSVATCTKKAVYYKSCVCGKASETDAFEHGEFAEHSFTEEKAEEKYLKTAAKCESKAVYYKSCSKCGEASETDTFEHGNVLGHNYSDWGGNRNGTHTKTCKNNGNHRITEDCSGGTATCTEQARCSKCGCKYGELAAHKFTMKRAEEKYLKSAATCESKAVYYMSCSCGAASDTDTFEYGEALGHEYGEWISNGNGTHTRTCKHDSSHKETKDCRGGTASCTEKATCEDCGAKYGKLENHGFTEEKTEARYLKSAASCTKKAVYYKSCVCGAASDTDTFEYGELAAHKFTIKRAEKKYLKSAATCESRAVYYMSCVCGAASDTDWYEYGDLGAHDYENHVCKTCGKEYQSEGLSFVLNDEGTGYIVAGIGSCHDADLVIPGTYNDLPVISIGEQAFYRNTKPKSVVIPNGVTSIGAKAFFYCEYLASIEIPSSVTSIGEHAFYYCRTLASIDLSGVTSIGEYAFDSCSILKSVKLSRDLTAIDAGAFSGCASLKDVEIPSGVTNIGASAFKGCASLASIEIPSGVTAIGEHTFDGCSGLKSVNIPSGITAIGEYAFLDCALLKDFEIPSGVTSIGAGAFKGCASLASIEIPSGVTEIALNTFYGCTALTSVEIPSGVTSIGFYAFEKCHSLVTVVIGAGVTSIGSNAFSDCYRLVEVYNLSTLSIKGGTTNGCVAQNALGVYTSKDTPSKISITDDGYVYYKDGSLVWLIGYNGTETELTLPEKIVEYSYSLYKYAFYGCTSLTSVVIPNGVGIYGKGTFQGCTSLKSVVLSSSVTAIVESMFEDCTSLESVTLPSSVTAIASRAFYNCSSLASIDLSGIKSIGKYAFRKCEKLTSIVIPDSVHTMGSFAFSGCTSLTSVVIGDGLYIVDSHTFEYCTSLKSVVIGAKVYGIQNYAFSNCYSLTSVVIPSSMTYIRSDLGMYSLTNVYYRGGAGSWEEIEINVSLTNVTIYYYSESDPFAGENAATDGNYWHYVDGVLTVWTKQDEVAA